MLGRAHVRLYCCSGEILDGIEKKALLVGYNVLGSYALARKQRGAPIEIVLPEDYTLVLSRVALIPRAARRPDLSEAFLNYLLSPDVQKAFEQSRAIGFGPGLGRTSNRVDPITAGLSRPGKAHEVHQDLARPHRSRCSLRPTTADQRPDEIRGCRALRVDGPPG